VAAEICRSGVLIQFNNEFLIMKKPGVMNPEAVFSAERLNLAFSFAGLQALSVNATDLARFPDTFRNGMAKAAIGDDEMSAPSTWMPPLSAPENVHAMLIVAATDAHELAKKVADITGTASFKAGVQLLARQEGEPVIGLETRIPTGKPCHEGPNPDPGRLCESGSAWTNEGAYLVFRRLRQDVPPLEKSIESLAKLLGWSEEMTGAKLVVRYRSGCAIEQIEFQTGPDTYPSIDTSAPLRIDPGKDTLALQHPETRTGEEYFFSPSLDTLQALGTGAI
jgi:hypothetical protein